MSSKIEQEPGKAQNHHEKSLKFSSTVTVRTKWELPVPVHSPGSIISYQFSTSQGDIGFGMLYKQSDGKEIVLKTVDRVPSHIGSATGSINPPSHAGVIHFTWDNSFSWLTSKELTYSIEIEQPNLPSDDDLGTETDEIVADLTNSITDLSAKLSKYEHANSETKFLEVLDPLTRNNVEEFRKLMHTFQVSTEGKLTRLETRSKAADAHLKHLLKVSERDLHVRQLEADAATSRLKTEIQTLQDQNEAAHSRHLSKLEQEVRDTEERAAQAKDAHEKLVNRKEEMQDLIEDLTSKAHYLQAECDRLNLVLSDTDRNRSHMGEKERIIRELRDLAAQERTDADAKVAHIRETQAKAAGDLEEERKGMEAKIALMKSKLESLTSDTAAVVATDDALKRAEQEHSVLSSATQALDSQHTTLLAQFRDSKEKLDSLAAEKAALDQTKVDLEQELVQLQKEAERLRAIRRHDLDTESGDNDDYESGGDSDGVESDGGAKKDQAQVPQGAAAGTSEAWFATGSFETYKKPAEEVYELASKDGSVETLEGPVKYKAGFYILTGPKGEKYPITPAKFHELKDDLGEGKCTPKKIIKKAKLADHSGSVDTSWGEKLHYNTGEDYIVRHGTEDYGVVKKDIFNTTYQK